MASPALSRRQQLLTNLISGLVVSFSEIISYVSLASLLFVGVLAPYLSYGVTIILLTTAINVVVMLVLTRQPDLFTVVRTNTTVLLGVAVVGATHTLPPSAAFATALAVLCVGTVGMGVTFWLLGRFRLGDLVRYVPYPVIGGFIAGTGWLLLRGAIASTSGTPFTLDALFTPAALVRWLPGVGLGILLFLATRASHHFLVMPALLIGSTGAFYLVLAVAGMSLEEADRAQLLVRVVDASTAWQPLPLAQWTQADWGAVLSQSGTLLTVSLVGVLTLLLNLSSMEVLLKTDFDVNSEMRAAGTANVLVGLMGGIIGFRAISTTTLSHRLGGRGHLPPLLLAVSSLLVLVVGLDFLAYTPKLLLGGVLFFLGLDYLEDWVFKGFKTLERGDYVVVLIILVTIALTDFLVGVGVGLVLMVLSFVVNYSRVNIFHYALDGSAMSSNVLRNPHHRELIRKQADEIRLLKLQGYLFFGTANNILVEVRQRLKRLPPLRFLILDFRRVTSVDSSAVFSLKRLASLAEMHDFQIILSSLTPQIEATLHANAFALNARIFSTQDMDYALEHCENAILGKDPVTTMNLTVTFNRLLTESGFSPEQRQIFRGYLQNKTFRAGEYLTRQGQAADELFFIEIGQVSIYLETEGEKRIRLQTLTMGSVVGELAFQLRMTRTASVVADVDTQAYCLTRSQFEALERDAPLISTLLKTLMLNALAHRLLESNQRLVTLSR